MRVEPRERAMGDGSASWWARLRLLPRPVLLFALLLFLSALAPVLLELHAVVMDPQGSTWLGALARRPAFVSGLSLAAALGALLAVEPPRRRSPAAYARKLKDRLAAIQVDFDGALRRRADEEEEKRHAPPPHPPHP
jgi:hypothetical protein